MPEQKEDLIDLVLPVHNEGRTIAATLREFYQQIVEKDGMRIRFVLSEDGSTDNTLDELRALQDELPIHLVTGKHRKGYSRAVVDGMREATSELIAHVDSDGQWVPGDFARLYEALGDNDIIVGYRNPRKDNWNRILMSRSFGMAFNLFFRLGLTDPSSSYLIVRRPAFECIFEGHVGVLSEGFWWEFMARADALGYRIAEIPVSHRNRPDGMTRVYLPTRVPSIAYQHFKGLFELKRELNQLDG